MAVPQPRLGANRYRIQRKVGSGAFGDVYIGTDRNTDKQVAIKLENLNVHNSVLPYEYRVYRHLRGVPGIPAVKWFGELKRPNVPHHMLVMELLGPSLEDLFNYNGGRFSVKTVLMLGDQMLARIEAVHAKSFLHRDIKPENFLMGMGSNTYKLYLIDFGLAKMYQNFKTKHHIPYRQDKSLTGTARYASLNAQQGIEQGRRDDLEAVGYVLIYFLRGSLPWQNLHASTKQQKYDRIREVKQSTSIDDLCQDLPPEFATYLKYCRGLRFDEAPDYMYVRQLFRRLFRTLDYQFDYTYDWTLREKKKAKRMKLEAAPET